MLDLRNKIMGFYILSADMKKEIERDLEYIESNDDAELIIKLINDSVSEIIPLFYDGIGSPSNVKVSHYYPTNNNIYLLSGMNLGELIHEIGHAIEYKLRKNDHKYHLNYIDLLYSVVKGKTREDVVDSSVYNIPIIKDCRFVTEYQGHVWDKDKYYPNNKVSIKALADYFAEGFRYYFIDPITLVKKDYPLYNFIKELIYNG